MEAEALVEDVFKERWDFLGVNLNEMLVVVSEERDDTDDVEE